MRCVVVNGVTFTVTNDFDETDPDAIDYLAWLAERFKAGAAEALTPEMVERQDAALARIVERNRRLRDDPHPDEHVDHGGWEDH
ncbi:hypothetical protein [Microbacterium sp. MMO-56]|uniref:hypothetical protein n=1 Tax=Microbacterium sp. MMO-56 TaxID=3081281 RepID=UPI003017CC6F